MYFEYGEKERTYLKSRDRKLGEVIDRLGKIERAVDTDLFSSLIRCIVGQQISTKAQQTIWKRMKESYGEVTPEVLHDATLEEIQSFGMSFRKAEYIKDMAERIFNGEFELDAIYEMTDREAIKSLSSLKGIGEWTAEMMLIFCLQRPDVFSFGDLAILRGMRMVYHHRRIDRKLFEKYRRRLSPYCSVASLYFWAVAGGAIPEMKDYAPKKKA